MTFALAHPIPAPTGRHDDCGAAYWPTPIAVVRAVLEEHPPPAGLWMVEPSAGTGAIAGELARRGHLVHAVEVREECREQLEAALPAKAGHVVTIGDWLGWRRREQLPYLEHGVCGNPPYNPADEMLRHVRHALADDPVWCALLLSPLNFVCGLDRAQLLAERPPAHVRPLVPRPAFGSDGQGGMRDVAWFVWLRGDTGARCAPMHWRQYG